MPELKMGDPWLGYNDALKRTEIDPSEMAVDSENLELSTARGKLLKRRGLQPIQNAENVAEVNYTTGPPVKYRFKGDWVQEVYSESLRGTAGDQSPHSVGILFTDEDSSEMSYAFFWYFDQATSPFSRHIMDTIASGGYPTANNTALQALLPSNDIAGPRFQSADHRSRHAIGSRSFLSVNRHTYFPCYGNRLFQAVVPAVGAGELNEVGIPHRWNNQHPNGYNFQPDSRVERVRPTGHQPPMWIPCITAKTAAAANQPQPWNDADAFFISVIYEWEDGSVSRPAMPRAVQVNGFLTPANVNVRYDGLGVSTGGVGFIRLAASGTNGYGSITWSGIPVPPEGVTRVGLCRTQKLQATAAGVLIGMPDLATMGLVAWVPPGTTTYEDPDGFDSANFPLADEDLIMLGGEDTLPSRARHMWTFDGRVGIGDLRMNPIAMYITFVGTTSPNQFAMNDTDNNIALASTTPANEWRWKAWFRICTDSKTTRALYLYARDYNGGAPISYVRRLNLTGFSLQQIVDAINGAYSASAGFGPYVTGGETGEQTTVWAAQLAPGVDGTVAAINLANTAAAANAYGDNTPNDGVLTRGTLTSAESTGAQNMTCRVYGPGMPGIITFGDDFIRAAPRSRAGIQFTKGGPDQPTIAPNAYMTKNFREAPLQAGRVMGGAGLDDGSLVCFSNAIGVMRNFRDQKTGFDDDYLLVIRWWGIGCISMVAEGPGFGVFLTPLGLMAADGEEIMHISEGLYNASLGTGSLAYEISQCVKATAADDHSDYFHCFVDRGRIWISYRSSASVTRPDRWQMLDFTPGKDQRGLAALVNPVTGKAFGWSTPYKPADSLTDTPGQSVIAPGAMGSWREPLTGTIMVVGTRDRHENGVKDGHVFQVDNDIRDLATFGGTQISYGATLFGRTNTMPVGSQRFKGRRVVLRYLDFVQVTTIGHARSGLAHTTNPALFSISSTVTASAGADQYTEFEWDLPLAVRGPSEAVETKVVIGGSVQRPEIFGMVFHFDDLDPKER